MSSKKSWRGNVGHKQEFRFVYSWSNWRLHRYLELTTSPGFPAFGQARFDFFALFCHLKGKKKICIPRSFSSPSLIFYTSQPPTKKSPHTCVACLPEPIAAPHPPDWVCESQPQTFGFRVSGPGMGRVWDSSFHTCVCPFVDL
jgi:hypothetical protein